MLKRCFFFICILFFHTNAYAEVQRIAVLEFRGIGIESQVLLKLSDQARAAALQALPREKYSIMTRENMLLILSDMGKSAADCQGECEVEIGRNISADLVVTGDILQMDGVYVLTLKLYNTETGNLLSTIDVESTTSLDLKKQTLVKAEQLFLQGLNLKSKKVQSTFTNRRSQSDWSLDDAKIIVDFVSNPEGAMVLVDGIVLCTATPCSKELNKGQHQVVFQKERYAIFQTDVNIQGSSKVNGTLEPQFGYLSVSSSANGVQMYLDGRPFATLPIKNEEVDLGTHILTIEDPCYLGDEYQFEITPSKRENIPNYPIEERQSALSVRAFDSNQNALVAKVRLDGVVVGKTPYQEKVPLCTEEVTVASQKKIKRQTLQLQERELSEVEFVFQTKKETDQNRNVDESQKSINSLGKKEQDNSRAKQKKTSRSTDGQVMVKKNSFGVSIGYMNGALTRSYDQFHGFYQANDELGTYGVYEYDVVTSGTSIGLTLHLNRRLTKNIDIFSKVTFASVEKQLHTGWEQRHIDDPETVMTEDSLIQTPITSIQPLVQLGGQFYIPTHFALHPYVLLGGLMMSFDGYLVPDLGSVDYRDRPKISYYGPTLGGGFLYEQSENLSLVADFTYTSFLNLSPYYKYEVINEFNVIGISQTAEQLEPSNRLISVNLGFRRSF